MTDPVASRFGANMPGDGLHVYVIAGEPSGDVIGARLIEALTAAVGPDLRVSGVGGQIGRAHV